MAKGLAAEIQAESHARRPVGERFPSAPQSTVRKRPLQASKAAPSPFKDTFHSVKGVPEGDRTYVKHTSLRSSGKTKVHLPDVTGLTSAVGSPSRLGIGYIGYDGKGDSEIEGKRCLHPVGFIRSLEVSSIVNYLKCCAI